MQQVYNLSSKHLIIIKHLLYNLSVQKKHQSIRPKAHISECLISMQ